MKNKVLSAADINKINYDFYCELKNLFELSKRIKESYFISSLLLIDFLPERDANRKIIKGNIKFIPYFIYYLAAESLSTIDCLSNIKVDNIKHKIKLTLLTFCHYLEMDFYYSLIANLIRLLVDRIYTGPCLQGQTLSVKMDSLEQLFSKLEMNLKVSMNTVKNELCNDKLESIRNAFSHSKYYIQKDKLFLIDPAMGLPKKPYDFTYIDDLLKLRTVFLITFYQVYEEFLSSYMDGNEYEAGIFKGGPLTMMIYYQRDRFISKNR